MVEGNKLEFVRKIRYITDYFLLKMPLPRINPNIISGLSILTSLTFILVVKHSSALGCALLVMTLFLDWLDGLVARRYNLSSEEGYMVDVTSDRLSEGIIFIPFFVPWFYLFALNNILTIYSFTRKRHVVLPLRHIFLVYFIINYL